MSDLIADWELPSQLEFAAKSYAIAEAIRLVSSALVRDDEEVVSRVIFSSLMDFFPKYTQHLEAMNKAYRKLAEDALALRPSFSTDGSFVEIKVRA